MSPITLTEIAGEKLTSEQTAYLDGLFAGLKNRGLSFGDVATNPAAEAKKSSPPENGFETLEERVKRELHPLDAFPVLLEHAASNKPPDKENLFRFKWHGLFFLSPASEAYMARLRIPGGQIKTFQLREIARAAQELTTGIVQITTRSNLQLRHIQPKDAPELLRRIQSVGLHTRGAGADNIRNLTASPTAGIDPEELIDTLPLCHQLGQIIINDRGFYDLPRKFNIAFDGGGKISVVQETNDIGFAAVRVDEGENISPGIYFRVFVGGASGHKALAHDLGVLVPPDETLKVATALLRVYIAEGNRSDRKKARLKHLLEKWSLGELLAATEKRLGYQLLKSDIGKDAALSRSVPHSHVGVFAQRQPGLNYVGVAVPVGQITPRQMLRLADLADLYGSGEIRFTVWQNLIIPNIPDAYIETVKRALVKAGLDWRSSNIRSGLVACTGNAYCKFAAVNTKRHALELADFLEKEIELDHPLNIHVTGCPNSCAQHYIGDIGLLGAKVKVAGESVEGYHVFVGGGYGEHSAIGRQLFQNISFNDLKPTLGKVFSGFLRHRTNGETFREFTQRHDLNRLQAIFTNNE